MNSIELFDEVLARWGDGSLEITGWGVLAVWALLGALVWLVSELRS